MGLRLGNPRPRSSRFRHPLFPHRKLNSMQLLRPKQSRRQASPHLLRQPQFPLPPFPPQLQPCHLRPFQRRVQPLQRHPPWRPHRWPHCPPPSPPRAKPRRPLPPTSPCLSPKNYCPPRASPRSPTILPASPLARNGAAPCAKTLCPPKNPSQKLPQKKCSPP